MSDGASAGTPGPGWVVPRWSVALARAEDLRRRCHQALDAGMWPSGSEAQHAVQRALWGLPIYALAGEHALAGGSLAHGSDAGTQTESAPVSAEMAAELRYRLVDRSRYTRWLCIQLERLGHRVRHPLMPPNVRGALADSVGLFIRQFAHAEVSSAFADDPVANRWTLFTTITRSSAESMSGHTVTFPPDCHLWRHRTTMITALDALLIQERGGWPMQTRVRTHGLPEYIDPDGRLAGELGVAPDRAVITAPVWELDHHRRTLADGAPAAYHLKLRSLRDGTPSAV